MKIKVVNKVLGIFAFTVLVSSTAACTYGACTAGTTESVMQFGIVSFAVLVSTAITIAFLMGRSSKDGS